MQLELFLLSFLVQSICIKYLYCSKIKTKQDQKKTKTTRTLSIIHCDLTLMKVLPVEFTRTQAGPKFISLIKEAIKQQPSNLKRK